MNCRKQAGYLTFWPFQFPLSYGGNLVFMLQTNWAVCDKSVSFLSKFTFWIFMSRSKRSDGITGAKTNRLGFCENFYHNFCVLFFSFFGFYYYFVLFYCHFFSPGIEVEGRLLRYFIWYSWVRGSRLRDIFLGSPFASHSNGQPFFFGGGFFFSINFVFSDHLLTESNLVSKQRSIYHLFTGHTPKLFWAIEELEVVCFYVVDFAR